MKIGDTGEAKFVVKQEDSAQALAISSEDAFPNVLATSRMVALMELAAARAMRELLGPGELSVGTGIDVRHLAPTPIGSEVRAKATFFGMKGKLFRFKVEAFDEGGLIGDGEHTRAIVDTDDLAEKARKRNDT